MTGENAMLFDQLPVAALVFLMVISCAVMHTAISRLVHAHWFKQMMRGSSWPFAIFTASFAGGAGAYLIFDKVVGGPLATYIAAVNLSLFAITGTFARCIKLFDLEHQKFTRMIVLIRTVHAYMYMTYIGLACSFLEKAA